MHAFERQVAAVLYFNPQQDVQVLLKIFSATEVGYYQLQFQNML